MSGHRGIQRARKPMSNKLSSSRAMEPQLVVTPPLQAEVDEADLLLALETFPDFKQCFFFPHFYLAVFATVHAADQALARLNTILPAPVVVKWDDWTHGDPQNGPYPEVSIAVESCHVFIVRNFLSATVLRKITFKFPGLLGGLPTLRGFIITFETSRQAFAFLDYLTAKTNLLPYFVVGRADPTPTAPRAELDRLGDYFANQCNEVNGPDQNSDLSSVRMFPHGDEASVLMDLCSSFPGWERVHLLGDQEAIVDFNSSVNARRFVRYLTKNTASASRLEPRPTKAAPTTDAADSPTIHLILTRKWQFSSTYLAQKRCKQWLESYQGFRKLAVAAQGETISVTFASNEYASAAARHIASTTNLLKGAEGFFSAERLKVWVDPACAFSAQRSQPKIPQGLVAAKQRQIELREIHNQEHDAAHRAYDGSHEGHSHDHEPHATAQAAEGATISELRPPGHTHPARDCTRYILQTLPVGRRITREEHEANMLKLQSQILAELETMKSSSSLGV
ncbi:hypothetical protein HDU87_005900 [Geranomyces variabilis]|uniref:Uncharacterized protein n=1 Tax=Geranomyces variabilis TaxID=109894 RepID=A0AAD5TQQ5_9FUNG|nr:hypothetical protein HDU87_005900 [Geranomyces variabilis]